MIGEKERRVEMPATLENQLIAFQVWQAFKRTYGGPFLTLMTLIVLILIGLSLSHHWTLKRLPAHHKKRIEEIHDKLKKDAVKEHKKVINEEKLRNKLRIIEDAYESKHISKKVYKKTKKNINDAIIKI